MRAFVTGGCGYIGQSVSNGLASQYDEIVIFELPRADQSWIKKKNIRVVEGDITDPTSIASKIKKGDHVYHLAGLGGARKVPDSVFREINTQGTINVFDAAVKVGAKKFLFMSSVAACGPVAGQNNSESCRCKPTNMYGKTKRLAEKYIMEKSSGTMTSVILRPPLIYGPNPHKDSGIYFLINSMKNPIIPVFGSGKNFIITCNVQNLLHGMRIAMKSTEKKASIYFIRDAEQMTMRNFMIMLRSLTRSKAFIISLPSSILYLVYAASNALFHLTRIKGGLDYDAYKGATSNDFVFSIEKIKNKGYSPKASMKDGFQIAIDSLS